MSLSELFDTLAFFTAIIVLYLALRITVLYRPRIKRGYTIIGHMRDDEGNDLPPIIWHHPGPWEEVLKHMPNSGSKLGDKTVTAWEVR